MPLLGAGRFSAIYPPLRLLDARATHRPLLKPHSTSPDPPQAGHAPVPPHLSQSPSDPASTAAPTSTPVPLHALHSPSPPHSGQGFGGAITTRLPPTLKPELLAGKPAFPFTVCLAPLPSDFLRLTPRITRPPTPVQEFEKQRVAGRVHALVRPPTCADVKPPAYHARAFRRFYLLFYRIIRSNYVMAREKPNGSAKLRNKAEWVCITALSLGRRGPTETGVGLYNAPGGTRRCGRPRGVQGLRYQPSMRRLRSARAGSRRKSRVPRRAPEASASRRTTLEKRSRPRACARSSGRRCGSPSK